MNARGRQLKKLIIFNYKWLRNMTATVILGSILHSSISVQAETQINNQNQNKAKVAPITINNQASYSYTDPATDIKFNATSAQLTVEANPLIDPLGKILGCGGELLTDYTGFSISVYEADPNDPTSTQLGRLVPLTRTELPDTPNNNIPSGKPPNRENSNPYFIQNSPEEFRGVYNFLLDPAKGQAEPGRNYILVVNPPRNSIYQQRRIKLQIVGSTGSQSGIGNTQNRVIRYVATSLDGQPIRLSGETQFEDTVVAVADAELQGLDLLALEFTTNMCQPNQVQIIKSGDRATAAPGDTPIYRLSVRNLVEVGLNNIIVTDNLPLGFKFLPKTVKGEVNGQSVNVTTEINGSTIRFRTDTVIPPRAVLNIAYATQLTPDAIRGSGRNSAIVNAERADNRFRTKDGPATHKLEIRPGIVSDCGTIIGRVFVDKNFDGEQQPNEPGVPNAVIFTNNGNRVTTDANGLYSIANVLPGNHTGVLDLSSLPGYTLAPNHYFKERNSQARLVRLEPGGMVRMNFAVTPTFKEEVKK